MLASRQSNRNHWVSVGRRARASGISLEAALTKSSTINEWIKGGYDGGARGIGYDYATQKLTCRVCGVGLSEDDTAPCDTPLCPINSVSA